MNSSIIIAIFTALLLPGLFMALMPMLPAISYLFFVAFIFALIDKFTHLSGVEFSILGGVWFLSVIIDYAAGLLGAKYGGASRRSILFGFLGLIIGTLLIPPFGGLAGLFLGVFLGEFFSRRGQLPAVKAAASAFSGAVLGMLFNAGLALLFFVLFLLFVLG